MCCGDRSRALRRLTFAQVTAFPELLDAVQETTSLGVRSAVADRFARLALAGRLRTPDPDLAADQFLALLTGPAETRSRLGTRDLTAADHTEIAAAAVRTFLCAYEHTGR